MKPVPRRRTERGQAAGIESIPFGVLVFVCFSLLAVNVWATIDAKTALDSAAREYLRGYTKSDSAQQGLVRGEALAREALGDRAQRQHLLIVAPQGRFGPCAQATVELQVELPMMKLPFVGEFGVHRVHATASELIDANRRMDSSTGLQGSQCDR